MRLRKEVATTAQPLQFENDLIIGDVDDLQARLWSGGHYIAKELSMSPVLGVRLQTRGLPILLLLGSLY